MTVIGTERGDYVALEGRGESEPDVLEMFAVESALEGDLPAMGSATGTSGALLGAAFATSLVTAVLAVSNGAVPGGTRVMALSVSGCGWSMGLRPRTPRSGRPWWSEPTRTIKPVRWSSALPRITHDRPICRRPTR